MPTPQQTIESNPSHSRRQISENIINSLSNAQKSRPTSQAQTSPFIPTQTISSDTISEVQTIRTTCPYCGVGCGVLASIDTNGDISVQGDPEHPANFGKLCSKGSNLAQTLGHERRLTQPYYQNKALSMQPYATPQSSGGSQINSQISSQINPAVNSNPHIYADNVTQTTDWDTVLEDIAVRLSDTIAQHGRDSVMFYVSGQLLTEDYYVANKLIKGFIGNNNIDSNSRLCMSSAVAGHKRAFGADLVTGSYTDFENCDLLVLVGSNMAWCHPILFGRFLQAKQDNPHKKLVVIDPRRTDSCEFADLHLPIAAGTDTHLYNGLLHYLAVNGHQDAAYSKQCDGLDKALAAANVWDIEAVAQATQVDAKLIEQFYQLVASNDKTVTAFSMGVNQSSSGTDKVNAITNTHLLTGRVGKDGANPFSLTGQPNAMGGREVGALANLLAAHLDLANSEHRQAVADFWEAPQAIDAQVGVTACEVADAILDGRIKALWIMATNPVVSLPEADKFRQALGQCDLVIVSECSKDSDTIQCADIVLPAQAWGEKSGTVTNSERRISRQRSLMPAAGGAKPDWWILSQVAQRMGFAGFDYTQPSDIFNEHIQLTGYKNKSNNSDGHNELDHLIYPRYLNLADYLTFNKQDSWLTTTDYDRMAPFQWGAAQIEVTDASFCHATPQFIAIAPSKEAGEVNRYSPNKDILISKVVVDKSTGLPLAQDQSKNNQAATQNSVNLRLITGRLRDQWHTMTRTALAPKLNQQQTMPTLTLHPKDAKRLQIETEGFICLTAQMPIASATDAESTDGLKAATDTLVLLQGAPQVVAQVQLSDTMRIGDAFMPMHWSDAFANLARVGTIIPTKVDPISSQPELKNSAVIAAALDIKAVGHILVHPDWLDAVLVQLRALSCQSGADNSHTGALVWSMSRQPDSILINLATAESNMQADWLNDSFWHRFVSQVADTATKTAAKPPVHTDSVVRAGVDPETTECLLSTSVMTNAASQQLRLIVTEPVATCLPQPELESESQPKSASNADSLANSQIRLAVYIAPSNAQLPSTHWLNACFADVSAVPSVKWLLAGRPASGCVDPGPIVCACMGVGERAIIAAIEDDDCVDALSVGKLCQAGTNCGSCVGQINELIKQYA